MKAKTKYQSLIFLRWLFVLVVFLYLSIVATENFLELALWIVLLFLLNIFHIWFFKEERTLPFLNCSIFLVDLAFVTYLVLITGGAYSIFYPFYFIFMVFTAIFFNTKEYLFMVISGFTFYLLACVGGTFTKNLLTLLGKKLGIYSGVALFVFLINIWLRAGMNYLLDKARALVDFLYRKLNKEEI